MKIALQYLNKVYLFEIGKIIKEDENENFFSNHYTFYISSEDGKIHKSKTDNTIVYYIDNDTMYFVTSLHGKETLQDFLQVKEDALNGVYDIREVVEQNLKNFIIEEDFSELTNLEISSKLKNMLAEKQKEWNKEKEEKAKKEAERVAKIEAEEELQRQVMITKGIENIKNNEFIDNETFEVLLKHFGIDVHIRTLSWIRKSLVKIKKDNYKYSGNRSEKTFEYFNELLKKVLDIKRIL
jgi:hypothetical protein